MVKGIVVIFFLAVIGNAYASGKTENILVFKGSKFLINIKNNCPEGYVDCQDVDYYSINLKTKSELRLKGETWNKKGSDDNIGFIFKNKNYIYTISDSDTPITSSTPDKCYGLLQLNVYHNNTLIAHDDEVCEK